MDKKKPQQNTLLVSLIILAGAVGGYLLAGQMSEPASTIEPIPQEGSSDWKALKSLKIDFGILDKAQYTNLKVFGESPVLPGATGKNDPFSGY